MFWGLALRANKRYSQTVTKTFHLSQAALDVSSLSDNADVSVLLTADKVQYVLCTLSGKRNIVQVPLDLVFSEGDSISFSSSGNVHLTGYLVPDEFPDEFGGDEDLGEEEEDDEEVPELVPADQPKKLTKSQKQLKKLLENQLDEDDDDDAEFENGDAEGDDDDEDDEDDDEDDDDDDDDEDDDDEDDDDGEEDDDEEEEIAEPVSKKQKQSNGLANGKAASKEQPKAAKKQEQAAQQPAKDKTLQGGVKVEDLRVGGGREAKPGNKVQVYYEGRLKSNNKVFDSSKSGQGFTFSLGRGEVIRGWDVGVAGMKVGSKRRITCPPSMAYGAKGAPPAIPGNATLVFDVEVRNVK